MNQCLCRTGKRVTVQGFTLVELLVVMALLSLVVLAMGSALRTAAQTEERVDVRLLRSDEMRVANEFLHSVLGRISARKSATLQSVGDSVFLFKGGERDLEWVGIMPARHGVGGRYHFRLGLEDRGGVGALILRFAPWTDDAIPPDWTNASTTVLAGQVRGMALQYQDIMTEPPVWTPQWDHPKRLPSRVMLSLQTASGPWPDIVVAMRVAPLSDPLSSGAVFGGSR
jgi:general secretion pathway protein J